MPVDLDGMVSFHDCLPLDDPLKSVEVKADLVVRHGAANDYVIHKATAAFKQQITCVVADIKGNSRSSAEHNFVSPLAEQPTCELGLNAACIAPIARPGES